MKCEVYGFVAKCFWWLNGFGVGDSKRGDPAHGARWAQTVWRLDLWGEVVWTQRQTSKTFAFHAAIG